MSDDGLGCRFDARDDVRMCPDDADDLDAFDVLGMLGVTGMIGMDRCRSGWALGVPICNAQNDTPPAAFATSVSRFGSMKISFNRPCVLT